MTWATCHTEDCESQDVPIDVGELTFVNDETGETVTISEVICGDCSQPITDLTDNQPDHPRPRLPEEGSSHG